jgi:hypothetical protein
MVRKMREKRRDGINMNCYGIAMEFGGSKQGVYALAGGRMNACVSYFRSSVCWRQLDYSAIYHTRITSNHLPLNQDEKA